MIRANEWAEACLLQLDFERVSKLLPASWIATPALVPRLSDIAANEYMVRE